MAKYVLFINIILLDKEQIFTWTCSVKRKKYRNNRYWS